MITYDTKYNSTPEDQNLIHESCSTLREESIQNDTKRSKVGDKWVSSDIRRYLTRCCSKARRQQEQPSGSLLPERVTLNSHRPVVVWLYGALENKGAGRQLDT